MTIERTRIAARRATRAVGARTLRLLREADRHRHRLMAAAVVLGILFMVIHWR